MRRQKLSKSKSRSMFKKSANKFHKKNKAKPGRGGTVL